MRIKRWGKVWAQTDFCGGWVQTRVRPKWYWKLARFKFALLHLWRRRYEPICEPWTWADAWEIAGFIENLGLSNVPYMTGPLGDKGASR